MCQRQQNPKIWYKINMRKFLVLLKANWQRTLEYRGDVAVWTVNAFIQPAIGMAIWLAILSSGPEIIYTKSDLIIYFIAIMWVNVITGAWGSYFIGEDIKTGNFSRYLIKPYSLLVDHASGNLGEKLFKILVTLITTIIFISYLFLNFEIKVNISYLSAILFLISLVLAASIGFLLDCNIGLATFWVHENDFLRKLYAVLKEIFSGSLIPVALLPGILLTFATILPFRYLLSFPAEVLLNRLSLNDLIIGFGIQTLWFLLIFISFKFLYKKGLKNYQAFGS